MFEKLKRFWKKLRRLRRFLTVVFFVLIIVVALFLGYCTTREIPLFVKQIIISKLHERGIEAEFGRAYLKLPGTVVARDVKLAGDAEDRHRVSFETGRLELGVFFWSLFGTSPELSVLSVGDGVIVLEAGGDKNGHDGDIRIENIGFDVESSTPGVLTLKNLQARFRRTSIVASGSITNGRRLSEWKPPASISIHDKEEKKDLGRIIEFINSVNLDGASSLKFEFYGNGRDGGSFNIHADAKLPGIRTAGIEASQVHF
ncbi:MAG: hypothetical protein K9N52_06440, partial [Verrucomicrobia bacterium]|nr:hypothetical protein [Verrucomicrobiota bacterium]